MNILATLLSLLTVSSAHAADNSACRHYRGNWIGAPTYTCDALPIGNGGQAGNASPKKIVLPH